MPRPLTESERTELLTAGHVAVVSFAADDGRPPFSLPIWYHYEPGGNLYLSTRAGNRKTRLARASRALTLVVHRDQPPYRQVTVEGTIVDIARPADPVRQRQIALHYLTEAQADAFSEHADPADSVVLTVRPDRWFTADFGEDL